MSDLEILLSLNQAQVSLQEARRKLDGVPDWMTELHAEYSVRKAAITHEEEAAEEAARERREAEATVADAQEKLARYQEQIGQVTTQREYGALLKEIDTVKGTIKTSEEAAIGALEASEAANSKHQELEAEFQELDERYQTELAKWEAEKPKVKKTAKALEKEIVELRESAPRGALALFDRVYDRTEGNTVSLIKRIDPLRGNSMWHCTECSYNARPQVVLEVRAGEIRHCESCKRILYWEPDADEDDDDE